MTNKYNPWASYHTEYTRRLERDRAIVERDEARRVACEQYTRANKLERNKDFNEKRITNQKLSIEFFQQNEKKLKRERDKLATALKAIEESSCITGSEAAQMSRAALDGVE